MNRLFLITIIAFVCACNTTPQPKQDDPIYLDQSILSNKKSTAGWLAYGVALKAWDPVYLEDGSLDYFNREVSAREMAAQIWKELKLSDASESDMDLDILEAISDAGFMDEYLWVYLKDIRWKDPGTLELDKFNEWSSRNLINHIPVKETGVSVGY